MRNVASRGAPAGRDDQPLSREAVHHVDGGVEHATGVVPEVQHEAVDAAVRRPVQAGELVPEILCRRVAELGNADIAVAAVKHPGAHAVDVHGAALEIEGQRFRITVASHGPARRAAAGPRMRRMAY